MSGRRPTRPIPTQSCFGTNALPMQVKKVGTDSERHLARLQAELRKTDKRHQDAMITKETTEFIVKRITKVGGGCFSRVVRPTPARLIFSQTRVEHLHAPTRWAACPSLTPGPRSFKLHKVVHC